ncbi:MAG TPA: GNAT family N-acetyltransferase, partial [Hanamia sp.]|nr:GNAT family N-acetyltransferase [Hanamia sp.]
MVSEEQYEFVRGTGSDEELEKYRKCFADNGSDKSIEVLKWFHKKNILRQSAIYYAIERKTNGIAAIYAYIPVRMNCMNNVVIGMQAIDALTDYKHRSKGLFTKVGSQFLNLETSKNYEFVYGFPNKNSAHGHIDKLGFTSFGEVPFLIKPIGISYALKKLLNKKLSHNVQEVNCKIDAPSEVLLKNNCSIRVFSKFEE